MALPAVLLHIMPCLSSVGVPRSTAGLVAGAIPLIGIIGRFGFGWLADLFDKRYLMAITYGFLGLGVLSLGFVHMRWMILPFVLLWAGCHNPDDYVLNSDESPHMDRFLTLSAVEDTT